MQSWIVRFDAVDRVCWRLFTLFLRLMPANRTLGTRLLGPMPFIASRRASWNAFRVRSSFGWPRWRSMYRYRRTLNDARRSYELSMDEIVEARSEARFRYSVSNTNQLDTLCRSECTAMLDNAIGSGARIDLIRNWNARPTVFTVPTGLRYLAALRNVRRLETNESDNVMKTTGFASFAAVPRIFENDPWTGGWHWRGFL